MSYESENQFLEIYEDAPMVLVSKGENRRYVEGFLTSLGIDKPDFPGGLFTAQADGKDWLLARDADMEAWLEEFPGAVGFMGSDRFNELNLESRERLEFCPVDDETGIRFVLATTGDKAPVLVNKLLCPQPIVLATSYQRQARMAIEAICGPAGPIVETLCLGGSVEAAPGKAPRVDAIFDVVDTGSTMAAEVLTIVADNLGDLTLGAVWRNDGPT